MRGRLRLGLSIGVLLVLLAGPVEAVTATQAGRPNLADAGNLIDPSNPNSATPSSDTGNDFGGNSEAHLGEDDHAGAAPFSSLWMKWKAPSSRGITGDTCHANNYDTTLEVYSGPEFNPTFGSLMSLDENDEGCVDPGGSKISWQANAGTTYYIALDRGGPTGGNTYAIGFKATPANDNFSGDQIVGAPHSIPATTEGATKEQGEPSHGGNPGGASLWWSWTPTVEDDYVVQTCGSGSAVDTLLAVYTGSAFTPGGLTLVTEDDDNCGQFERLSFHALAGTTYRIALDNADLIPVPGVGNNVILDIAAGPPNDQLIDAEPLGNGFPASAAANTTAATRQDVDGEPNHGGAGVGSVWYTWLAADSGPVTIDTCGSTIGTRLGVYNNSANFPITAVSTTDSACDDDVAKEFTAAAGTTYLIAVDSIGIGGAVALAIHDTTPPTTTIDAFKNIKKGHKARVTFSGLDDRGGTVTFTCQRDTKPIVDPCLSPMTFKKVKPKRTHTITITGTDAAGNPSTATKTYKQK